MNLTEITEYEIMLTHKVDKSIIAARVVYLLESWSRRSLSPNR
jgi:hypothetical protein